MTDELSLDFITGALKIQLPPIIVARTGWKFDIAALVEAHNLLGLEKEVRFRFSSGSKKAMEGTNRSSFATYASHRIKVDMETMQYYHAITISQELPIEKANECIWHELRHGWQAEAFARQTGKAVNSFYAEAYKKAPGEHGATYIDNRWEIDARNYAANRCNENKWLITTKQQ